MGRETFNSASTVLRLPPYDQIQIVLFSTTLFVFTTHFILLIWPLWALMNSAVSSPTLGAIFFFKGLFSQCVQYMPGQYQCDNGLRPLFLKTAVTICMQSFAIISQIFLAISLALQLFGMECSKCFFRSPETKTRLMKISAFLLFCAGVFELTTASLYTSMIVKKFKGEEYWSSDYLPGQKLNVDLDQVRFELGGCTYAAFCISFIDMVLAYAVYKKRGFEDLRYHQQEDKKLEEDKYKTWLNQMGQQGQMPRTSEFEPYYTVASLRS